MTEQSTNGMERIRSDLDLPGDPVKVEQKERGGFKAYYGGLRSLQVTRKGHTFEVAWAKGSHREDLGDSLILAYQSVDATQIQDAVDEMAEEVGLLPSETEGSDR